jgi:GT2 family glycosyltransferase
LLVAVVVVAYNQPVWTARLFETAVSSEHDVAFHLFLHSDDGETARVCETLARRTDVRYYPYGVNRGVSRAWNEGILAARDERADAVVVANDDVYFSPGDLDRIAAKASSHRERYIVSCAGYHERLGRRLPSHGYSCFAINPIALETIGCFDENFFPAYCEDQDYARRAALAGLTEENCADVNVVHAGSAAIYASAELMRRNAATQGLNMAYYVRKWGDHAGRERFTRPFGNPDFQLRIAPEERAAPYGPGYDRTDREPAAN